MLVINNVLRRRKEPSAHEFVHRNLLRETLTKCSADILVREIPWKIAAVGADKALIQSVLGLSAVPVFQWRSVRYFDVHKADGPTPQ